MKHLLLALFFTAQFALSQCYSSIPNIYYTPSGTHLPATKTAWVNVGSSAPRLITLLAQRNMTASGRANPAGTPSANAGRLDVTVYGSTSPNDFTLDYDFEFFFPSNTSGTANVLTFIGYIGTDIHPLPGIPIPGGNSNANITIMNPIVTHTGGTFATSTGPVGSNIVPHPAMTLPVLPVGSSFYLQYLVWQNTCQFPPLNGTVPFGHQTTVSELVKVTFQ